jgi:hypothetical protein
VTRASDQSPTPDWKGGADALTALAERLGCRSWGGWVNKCVCYQVTIRVGLRAAPASHWQAYRLARRHRDRCHGDGLAGRLESLFVTVTPVQRLANPLAARVQVRWTRDRDRRRDCDRDGERRGIRPQTPCHWQPQLPATGSHRQSLPLAATAAPCPAAGPHWHGPATVAARPGHSDAV